MVFAAGLGTRLRPLTDSRPKALVEVEGRPLLWYVLHRLTQAGFTRIVVNVHHFAEQIIDYVGQLNDSREFGPAVEVLVSDEREQLLETGGGVRRALPLFDQESPILIHNVDIFSNADLRGLYEASADADAVLLVSDRDSTRRLVFADNLLQGWMNLTTGATRGSIDGIRLAFAGLHVVSPTLFAELQRWPEERFSIIDFYLSVCQRYRLRPRIEDGLRLIDVGKPDTLRLASEFLNY